MSHSRSMNNEINRLHVLFPDLLAGYGSVTKHTRNCATEVFKVHKNMSTELMQGLFCVRPTHYNLINPHHFTIPSINSVYHASESISNIGPRIWDLVSDRLKELNSIGSFKNEN